MPPKKNLVGKKFGRLKVLKEAHRDKWGNVYWVCRCSCGNIKNNSTSTLNTGKVVSCGCYKEAEFKKRVTTHGQYKSRLYSIWRGMKSRCYTKNNSAYHNYGGRGIKVCKQWMEYKPFMVWAINNGYSKNLTLERINNDRDYKPSNCKWATKLEQAQNTRRSNKIEYMGQTKTLTEWSRITGVNTNTIKYRLKQNYPLSIVFSKNKLYGTSKN